MSAVKLSDEDVERIARAVVDRLDARLRKARPSAKRRTKDPELAAQIAREVVQETRQIDDVAKARAAKALEKIRRAG